MPPMMMMVLLVLGTIPFAAVDATNRPSTGNNATSNAFEANMELLFVALQKNAFATPPFLYAKGSVGVFPDIVYGLALCRGDTNASSCSACIADASRRLRPGVFAWYDNGCFIYFSRSNFLDGGEHGDWSTRTNTENLTAPLIPGWDPGNEKNDASNRRTIKRLLQETAKLAVNTTTRYGSARMILSSSSSAAVYSMAQCTPDLTPIQCWNCLKNISEMATDKFAGKLGSHHFSLWCNLRYEAYQFYYGEPMQHIDMNGVAAPPQQELPHRRRIRKVMIISVVVPLLALFICIIMSYGYIKRNRQGKCSQDKTKMILKEDETLVWGLQGRMSEFKVYDLSQVLEATCNFSEENKLGQGGFGSVYKGCFHDGLEIAVKRLASHSGQGFTEFKNEIELIANLQHTNLVKLLGYCSQGEEKILIYEYLPNKSLDFFIFDENRRALLDWKKRLAIIDGVAQGILYLHKHSRLRVIHRDLKASNILLDGDMNPKISDFGLAKIFNTNNTEGNTNRIVGTYGYMAPEYAFEGLFSIKSDVFSFGVLILEIITGKRTSNFHRYGDYIYLLGHAWQLWKDGLCLQLVDESMVTECHALEMTRCINIALLCVQESADDRPTMTQVATMLSSESMTLPEPKHPAYFHIWVTNEQASTLVEPSSINDVTVSALRGR